MHTLTHIHTYMHARKGADERAHTHIHTLTRIQHSLQEERELERAELRERERKIGEMLAREREENRKRQEEGDRQHEEMMRKMQKNIATDNEKSEFIWKLVKIVASVVLRVVCLVVFRRLF